MISDIHANLAALEAVLGAIDATAVDEVWCLGDVVGYGAEPDACADLVRDRCDFCLVGNHDLAVLGELDISAFSEAAAAAVAWTRANASAPTLQFLRELQPIGARDGVAMYHASPRDPVWEYVVSAEQADVCFEVQASRVSLVGHSHVSLFFARPEPAGAAETRGGQTTDGTLLDLGAGTWLVNPGSVGQPRDGDPRAAWLELDTGELTARFRRVPYDVGAAADSIAAAGLPARLAERLFVGR